MAPHKKYDMLIAKAENMDLVILLKYQSQPKWVRSPNSYPPNNNYTEAFLCLPKHESACLHALNKGSIHVKHFDEEWKLADVGDKWQRTGWYMSNLLESRIGDDSEIAALTFK